MSESQDLNSEILMRVQRIEETLEKGQLVFELFNHGLHAYKDRLLNESDIAKRRECLHKWLEQIRCDKDLRFPHRKILEYLLSEYDLTKEDFSEVHFSKLVRASKIGKHSAAEYLQLLERKGYIQTRSDGYRKFFKIQSRTQN